MNRRLKHRAPLAACPPVSHFSGRPKGILPPETPYDRAALIRPDVMQDPVVWLASDASQEINGRRFIARNWDESLPIEERLEKAGAPAAWPQLGQQSVAPGRE